MKIKAILKKDKLNKDNTYPVVIRFTSGSSRYYHYIGLSVPEKSWNGEIFNYPDAAVHNTRIRKIISDIQTEEAVRKLHNKPLTIEAIKSILKAQGTGDFLHYAQGVIDEIKNDGTKRRYQVELDHLEKYANSLTFSDITPVFLNRYFAHLKKSKEHNSAINGLKFIRKVFNHAKDHGVTTLYPFAEFKYPKYVQPNKAYLTLEETEGIAALLDEDIDETMKKVAAFFLLECYSGFRFSDWSRFERETLVKDSSLKVLTKKTNKYVYIPLDSSPKLLRVVNFIGENYDNYDISNEHTNRILKAIAALCKIKKNVTTHTARRTYGTLLLEKGFSNETVAEALGVSMRVVSIYAKMTGKKIKAEFSRLGGL